MANSSASAVASTGSIYDAPASGQSSSWIWPVVIAAGVLLLLGGMWFLRRKKNA